MEEKLSGIENGEHVKCKTIHAVAKFLVDRYYRRFGFTNKPELQEDTQDVLREIVQKVWFKHTGEDLKANDPKVTRLLKSVNKVRGNALAAVAERELVDTILYDYE
jgi:hypothetical protein